MSEVIFVSGIHTDAGKSYATGWLARSLSAEGKTVVTQKFIQTGECGQSGDIAVHRRGHRPAPGRSGSYHCATDIFISLFSAISRVDRRQGD